MNIFAEATKKRLRFDTPKGMLTVEDIWQLPLVSTPTSISLDDVARHYNTQIKTIGEESFVSENPVVSPKLILRFDIVKYIIKVRLADAKAARNAATTKAKDQKLMEIIANKEDAALLDNSIEALKGMLSF